MSEARYIEEAKVYVENDKTINDTAKDLGISKRTLQLHLAKVKDIDLNLHYLVLAKKTSQIKAGRIKGGTISKATSSYNREDVENIAKAMLRNEMTYTEAETEFGIPKSTIYELMHSSLIDKELRDSLDILAEANKKSMTVQQYCESKRTQR